MVSTHVMGMKISLDMQMTLEDTYLVINKLPDFIRDLYREIIAVFLYVSKLARSSTRTTNPQKYQASNTDKLRSIII